MGGWGGGGYNRIYMLAVLVFTYSFKMHFNFSVTQACFELSSLHILSGPFSHNGHPTATTFYMATAFFQCYGPFHNKAIAACQLLLLLVLVITQCQTGHFATCSSVDITQNGCFTVTGYQALYLLPS